MTWTKLGDEFSDECWTLSDRAYRLHVEALGWCNKKLTDGQLAKDDMSRWAHHPDAAEELVSIGWWEDRGEHFQIIHHIGYQRTREQIAHQSIVNARNRAKGKARPVRKASSNDSSDEVTDEMDRAGQDRTGAQKRTKIPSEQPKKKNHNTTKQNPPRSAHASTATTRSHSGLTPNQAKTRTGAGTATTNTRGADTQTSAARDDA